MEAVASAVQAPDWGKMVAGKCLLPGAGTSDFHFEDLRSLGQVSLVDLAVELSAGEAARVIGAVGAELDAAAVGEADQVFVFACLHGAGIGTDLVGAIHCSRIQMMLRCAARTS